MSAFSLSCIFTLREKQSFQDSMYFKVELRKTGYCVYMCACVCVFIHSLGFLWRQSCSINQVDLKLPM